METLNIPSEITLQPNTLAALQELWRDPSPLSKVKLWSLPRNPNHADFDCLGQPIEFERYLIFAKEEYGDYVCIDLLDQDTVIGLDWHLGFRMYYNSSLSAFASSSKAFVDLQKFRRALSANKELTTERNAEVVASFEKQLQILDPIGNPKSEYWLTIIEQLEIMLF